MTQADEEIIAHTQETTTAPVAEVKPSVIDTLSGSQKAAALLVAMGKPAASRLIKHFSPDDLRRLSGQAHTLPDIKIQDFEKLVQQFEDAFAEGVSFSQAGARFTTLVQENLSEDEAAAVLDPNTVLALPHESVIEILSRMTADELQPFFANEHPQVVAYIISLLPDDLAARVLLAQTMAMRASIVQRTLYLAQVQPDAEKILEEALHPVLANQTKNEQQSHYKQIAMILNQLDKNDVDEVMASLESLKEEDLMNIKARMFVFEDIARLSVRARLLLFDGIAPDTIIKALRGADPALNSLILASLSQRTRRMVEAELSQPDDQLLQADILRARREIADIALRLADLGTISLAAEGEAA